MLAEVQQVLVGTAGFSTCSTWVTVPRNCNILAKNLVWHLVSYAWLISWCEKHDGKFTADKHLRTSDGDKEFSCVYNEKAITVSIKKWIL